MSNEPLVVLPTEAQCRDAAWDAYGVITVDQDGKIVNATAKAESLFGYTVRRSLINKSIDDLVATGFRAGHPRLREQHQENPSQKVMNGGRKVQGCRKDGTEISVVVILNSQFINDRLYTQAVVAEATG